jgi:hypothetical protein
MSRGEATARVRTAELLRLAPDLGEQLAAGEIGLAQVRELARLLSNPRIPNETVIDALPKFVEHAHRDPALLNRQTPYPSRCDGAPRPDASGPPARPAHRRA